MEGVPAIPLRTRYLSARVRTVSAMPAGSLDAMLLPWAEEAEPFNELGLRALVVRHVGPAPAAAVVRWVRSAHARGLLERVEWASGVFYLVSEAGQRRRDELVRAPIPAPRRAA